MRRHPNDVALVYRHLPIHEHAHAAGVAAECADKFGKFAAFHDAMFRDADSIGVKSWSSFALDAGIRDTARFQSCLNESAMNELVVHDSAAAVGLGIQGTPAILINDLLIAGNPGIDKLNEYVETALKKAR